jgi:haloacetate dehalogenase
MEPLRKCSLFAEHIGSETGVMPPSQMIETTSVAPAITELVYSGGFACRIPRRRKAMPMFKNFQRRRISGAGTEINLVMGGAGPPVLLLHGYSETHIAWHRVAPALAQDFTVVATDLRGYGDSGAPQTDEHHRTYSKRAMATDQLAVMKRLGFEKFAVVGHDRGARVGYRLALDHPQAVTALVSLTVIPTTDVWAAADKSFGTNAYHWFLFVQEFDLPERLIGADPDFFLDWTLRRMVMDPRCLAAEAVAEYRRCFRRAEVRHAMMEDYRAGAGCDDGDDKVDLAKGNKLACPVQVLWDARRASPIEIWRRWADRVEGIPIDAGHLLAEEAPEAVLAAITPFLQWHGTAGSAVG